VQQLSINVKNVRAEKFSFNFKVGLSKNVIKNVNSSIKLINIVSRPIFDVTLSCDHGNEEANRE
jgi:hypothetical protein